jgi:hypothetical protein
MAENWSFSDQISSVIWDSALRGPTNCYTKAQKTNLKQITDCENDNLK